MRMVQTMIWSGTSVQCPYREPSTESGLGAWHPTLYAANNVACLRTVRMAPPQAFDRRQAHPSPIAFTVGERAYFACSPNSSSCRSSTPDGASVIRHDADVVFGKAMTSRMESRPAMSMIIRSIPRAIPPCGGTP